MYKHDPQFILEHFLVSLKGNCVSNSVVTVIEFHSETVKILHPNEHPQGWRKVKVFGRASTDRSLEA